MKLTKQEKQILVEIFKSSNGLFLFTLHRQLNVSPKELFNSVENLKSNKLAEVIEDRVRITDEGRKFAVKIPLKNKFADSNKRSTVKHSSGKRLNINEFYIPQNFEK